MGAHLRAARRRQRVGIERAAEETKIKADFLMRMESDEFDFLAPAYVRGFLRSYARFLGLDEEPFLEDFDRRFGTATLDTAQLVATDRSTGRGRVAREHKPLSKWAVGAAIVAGVLLLLGVVGLFAPKQGRDRGEQAASTRRDGSEGEANRKAGGNERPSSPQTESPTPTPSPTESPLLAEGIDL
jgi:cytoskeleton protein RodZ